MTATPEDLRDAGMERVRNNADPRAILFIDALIDAANECGKPWSANDIRDQLPVVHQNLVGDRVRAASMRRPVEMVSVGEVQSNLASTHAKPIKVWQGAWAADLQVAS